MHGRRFISFLSAVFVTLMLLGSNLLAQSTKTDTPSPSVTDQNQSQEVDPLKRKVSDKQRKEQQKALKGELSGVYKKWLNEDARWIITDEELSAFKQLSNDEERDNFIEQFWLRRDPTPDTVENEFKEEHYRRIAYANEHFAAGKAGWRTDRGMIYIKFGPADEIESHPSGGLYERPTEEGGGETSTFPFETWRYRYLEGLTGSQKQEVIIEFVDTCMCNDYHMTMDRSEKDALKNVPGAGLTLYEQMGITSKADRFSGGGLEQLGQGPGGLNSMQTKQFDRMELFANLQRAPAIKFKDLEEVVSHKLSYNLMPFEVQTDFVKVTSDTVLVPVTIQIKNKDITFVTKEGVSRGTVNIFGRVTTLTQKIAQTFEDTVQVDLPAELLPKSVDNSALYWKALPLKPGRYRMDLVLKDINGDRMGTWSHGIIVPEYSEDQLASSTLIIADQMEKVPTKSVGTGNFVIGTTKIRPRVGGPNTPALFKRNQKASFWMQVYGLSMDDQTKKPSANIDYEIKNIGSQKQVVHMTETTAQLGNVGEQITLQKTLPLASLEPGIYQITIKINDNVSKREISPTAKFTVE